MKKVVITMLWLAGSMCAQQSSRQYSSYTYDVNGHPVGGRVITASAGPHGTTRTERVQSVSGHSVPLETVQEKVLREGPQGKVIERVIQRYDQDGRPTPPEKIRIEERKAGGGRTVITATRYRGDLNGHFRVAEKSVTEAVKHGDTVNATTIIERPALDGSIRVAEKHVTTEKQSKTGSTRQVVIYRRNQDGRFEPAARETTQVVREANRETTTTARYNTTNSGRMELAGQTVTNIEKHPDGSQTTVVNVYGPAAPGRPINGYSADLHLREQQIIERRKSADGSFIETTGVRRASLSDPEKLGDYQLVSQVVCTGNCEDNGENAGAGYEALAKGKPRETGEANSTR